MKRRNQRLFDIDPDQFGNYYFGKGKTSADKLPAVFPHKILKDSDVLFTGTFTVLLSADYGFLTNGQGKRRHFKTLATAFAALRNAGYDG